MTWEEKLARLKELAPTHLEMRKPGDWYVSAYGRDQTRPGHPFLVRRCGYGDSPQAAVEADWRLIAEDPVHYVVLDANGPERRHVRWDGERWAFTPFEADVEAQRAMKGA